MRYDIIADGVLFPEGPVALPNGELLVCEMGRNRLIRIARDGKKTTVAEIDGCPNGAAIGPDGACYICNNGGFEWGTMPDGIFRPIGPAKNYTGGSIDRVDLKTGKVTKLYTQVDGRKLIGPNDLVFDRDGGLWFSDLGKTRAREMDLCGAYYAKIDGSLIREVAHPFYGANGIGLSPDDKTLYVAETPTGRLWAFDILGPGKVSNAGWLSTNGGRAVYTLPGIQRCDSMAVEANGNICVATLRTGAITVVSPGGHLVELVTFPDPMVTNICFGGDTLTTAYVTLSGTGKIARMEWARPGHKLAFN